MRFLVSLLAVALLTSCATAAEPARRWTGVYEVHFETSAFTPEDGGGPWWLTPGDAEAQAALNAAIIANHAEPGGPPWGRALVTVEGALSTPGHYGHLAAYDREITVTRVVSATRAPPP